MVFQIASKSYKPAQWHKLKISSHQQFALVLKSSSFNQKHFLFHFLEKSHRMMSHPPLMLVETKLSNMLCWLQRSTKFTYMIINLRKS